MSDIDDIISGARGNTRADFASFDPAKAFFDASKQRADFDTRRAFQDGVPTDGGGQPDFGAIAKTFFQKGAIDQGLAATKLGLEQQRLKYGMDASKADFQTGQPSIVSPPSVNRSGGQPVAPPIAKPQSAPVASPGSGDQPGSIVGMVSAAGVPDELAGPIIGQVSAMARIDPNKAVPPEIAPRVQQVLQAAVQRLKSGGQPQLAPQAQPTATTPQAATTQQPGDPTLGGLVPPGRSPQQWLELLTRRRASGLLTAEQDKAYADRIKALQDALQPTTEMKNAAASGMSLSDYQNRSDENTSQREILTKSILPKLDKSQDTATAARDEVLAINRAREQLDAPGGIFSGSAAEVQKRLAKVGSLFGIDNSKITNTEAFSSAIGTRVLSLVKNPGSGTAISNSDREFAAAMAGGNIKLNEKSIRRILDIGEKAARVRIDQHDSLVDRTLKSSDALKDYGPVYKVDQPNKYSTPDAYQKARDAIEKGAPRDAVMQRLQKAGFDPGRL